MHPLYNISTTLSPFLWQGCINTGARIVIALLKEIRVLAMPRRTGRQQEIQLSQQKRFAVRVAALPVEAIVEGGPTPSLHIKGCISRRCSSGLDISEACPSMLPGVSPIFSTNQCYVTQHQFSDSRKRNYCCPMSMSNRNLR